MRKATLYVLGLLSALFFIVSCASIGHPSGGPRDEDPPRFLTSTPLQGAVDVTPNKVVLTFDEYVTLKDAFSKVVVSPPGAQVPRVSYLGKKVTVEFRDTLKPNTTYTIDFGDAIADNNEGNQLENFIYTFSTGPVLDTLMVSGMVLGAEDLEPATGYYVGLHSNLSDTAFIKTRFDRIAKVDKDGRFVIGGLAPGQYRIYALEDKDGDMAWSSPDESLAFYDAIIEPTTEYAVATDTIYNLLNGAVDSIIKRERTRFLPNNILLRSYNTGFRQQYISKYERVDSTRINFIFNAPADTMPQFDVILPGGAIYPISSISVAERSATNDTLSFWLTDPAVIASDTLRVAVEYLRPDSAYNPRPVNDTLRLLTQKRPVKAPKVEKAKKNKADTLPPPVPTIAIKVLNPKPEINMPLLLEFPEPVEEFNTGMVRLEMKNDTVWKTVEDFSDEFILTDTLNPRRVAVDYPWEYATNYRLTVDSLAAKGIYGLYTDDLVQEFATRAEADYGSIKLNISHSGRDNTLRFVQLLNAQGNPIDTKAVNSGSVKFEYLLPGKYNFRLILDSNGNGKWDPGNFVLGEQPDVSYYYKETVELKPNWDQEIDWNVFSTPVDKMKPESLRKKK